MALSLINPCLWFDGQAEEAAQFYISIFPNSKITAIQRYTGAGKEIHGHEPGSVMVVEFELNGQTFSGLNGGPQFKFTEAISFQVNCDTQAEIDHYWTRLAEGADESRHDCGWVMDKYGLAWQILPKALKSMLSDSDEERRSRVTSEMMKMKKLDLARLEKAYEGVGLERS
ncbi:VOC family protein [Aspergillus lucknowensis]|uniref:3-demethylubiquinone-9 3-methyltransferase-domain-containing protein n=1 Tax=Aspergillus lucknowensis TaxID=176173 RepID=A0ABR4LIA6_9EURO